ncbi:MAG TPA: tRNA (adenosine(37)-N6)-dimethylallyltransferase MiaA [Woeseiaceae bacterium]|nr:tRNA (adenosine(37)-N6)-dimethylallyltransferase MiaA [Woeseiaceae bacterium]
MADHNEQPAVCLMGPTASGKTELAVRLVESLPLAIVSVDSAMVYRGMDIGTAKPGQGVLERAPHRLIDIREPEETYSAGDFVRDARAAMAGIRAAGRVPLLVGGTMMYFRALTEGLAELPTADAAVRRAIDDEARAEGWPAMHARLAGVDPAAAARIDRNDRQRIQRALEVWRVSGKPLSAWQAEAHAAAPAPAGLRFGLVPEPRAILHRRIERRLRAMLEAGFVDEVARLKRRPLLDERSPAMRAVGYRQLWSYLDGRATLEEAVHKAVTATRQLAKRQLTWLRTEAGLICHNPLEADVFGAISARIRQRLE